VSARAGDSGRVETWPRAAIASDGSPARSLVVPQFRLTYSRFRVKNRTDTLETGSKAPGFSLGAANREGTFSLAGLLQRGTLILEFLRGTW
jgi:hypothetical protein